MSHHRTFSREEVLVVYKEKEKTDPITSVYFILVNCVWLEFTNDYKGHLSFPKQKERLVRRQ